MVDSPDIPDQAPDENESIGEVKHDLDELEREVSSGSLSPQASAIIDEIDKMPSDEATSPKFWEYIQKKDYTGALMEAFAIVGRYMDAGKPGLENMKGLKEKATALNLGGYTEEQLLRYISYIEQKIVEEGSLNKKMHFVYVLSQVKDAVAQKHATDGSPLDQYALLGEQVSVGSVLLLNKESRKGDATMAGVGDMTGDLVGDLLKSYDDSTSLDFIHSAMVTKIEEGKVYITHATMHRVGGDKAGSSGLEEVELTAYLKHFVAADVMVLEPPKENKTKALAFVGQKMSTGAGYDFLSAASASVRGNHEQNNAYNCAELIAAGMGIDALEHVTHPNDFLVEGLLKPTYITTVREPVLS